MFHPKYHVHVIISFICLCCWWRCSSRPHKSLEKQSLSLKFEPILLSFFWQFIHDNLLKFNNEIEPSRWPINRGRQCLIATQACYTDPPSGSNANKKLYYYANMPSWLLQLKLWSFTLRYINNWSSVGFGVSN